MGSRILIEILILLSPFAIFGLYRMAVAEAAAEGKKPWPVQRLFLIGFVLALIAWFVLLFLDKRELADGVCYGESQVIDGKIVPGPVIPCERNVRSIGIPASDDPGARSAEDDPAPEEPAGEDDE